MVVHQQTTSFFILLIKKGTAFKFVKSKIISLLSVVVVHGANKLS